MVITTRVRAPELLGAGGWINTPGITLADLRGKIVLLDFWTFCCVNCLHVADELRPLEAKYADVLVVIGVHSPKFVHETDHRAVEAAVERYGITHAVLDDPQLSTWNAYTARAWPTLVVVDPEGYVVAHLSGEGHGPGLDTLISELVAVHESKGTLRRGDAPYVSPPAATTQLRFPGKAISLPDGGVLVSDSGHHSIVILDGDDVRRRIGDGSRGLRDGAAETARFSEPQGICLLPNDIAEIVGYDVVVADTVNHALRGLRLTDLTVQTVAGTGKQRLTPFTTGEFGARDIELSSPWDVVWWPAISAVVIAMAGTHQLVAFDPVARTVRLFAGTGHEGLVDGKLDDAWFAQPSGLAVGDDRLWIADSESSALRYIDAGVVHTAIGRGLFSFGHKDGTAAEALLQHPLGVAALADGSVAVADTYNGAIRRYDPASDTVSTLANNLEEPSDAFASNDVLVVVESGAHRLTAVPLRGHEVSNEAHEYATRRDPTALRAGNIALTIAFTPPSGEHFDDRFGPSTRLTVEASPPTLLLDGAGSGPELTRTVVIADEPSEGVLHVTASAATCDDASDHAACHLHQQDWGIPVKVTTDGAENLDLMLRGLAR